MVFNITKNNGLLKINLLSLKYCILYNSESIFKLNLKKPVKKIIQNIHLKSCDNIQAKFVLNYIKA